MRSEVTLQYIEEVSYGLPSKLINAFNANCSSIRMENLTMEDLGAEFEFEGTVYQIQTIDTDQIYAVEKGNISEGRVFTEDEVENIEFN